MANYELISESTENRSYSCWRIALLIILYVSTTVLVFLSWNSAYDESLHYPRYQSNLRPWWFDRVKYYTSHRTNATYVSHDFRLIKNQTTRKTYNSKISQNDSKESLEVNILQIHDAAQAKDLRLVCYYGAYDPNITFNDLRIRDVDANLCTHINIGIANVENSTIQLSETLVNELQTDVNILRSKNKNLKVLLWIGGGNANSYGFSQMVKNHSTRKIFIRSIKETLHLYKLDGIDLDWEFPSAYNKERQHFSQLLYEIRQEYNRERRNYLLSVAVASVEGIALFAYDVAEINKYADHVNLMTYDYHFYSKSTPFTGLNAPLYARANEHSILSTLNINYSVNWWLQNGLAREKLVVGLATYGHSFTLVNPFNNRIGGPAEGIGHCGSDGFSSYYETCWFSSHNFGVSSFYDEQTCSPYLSCGNEWISYENERSIECKTLFVKKNNFGGVMMFSLNTDDFKNFCHIKKTIKFEKLRATNASFPLVKVAKMILFGVR